MKQLRILPLLLFVAMLAFSVRLVDVISGVSSLSGSAMAESVKEKSHETEEYEIAANTEDDHGDTMEAEEEEAHTPESMAEEMSMDAPEWRDAGDEDPGYLAIKQELFDELSARRKDLDAKEREIQTKEALLRAAEQELDRKVQELSQLRQEIEGLLREQSDEEKARVASLVKIYEGMKPKDAARIFDTLDLDILVSVVGSMSERKLSPILAAMNPERARTITIMLAEQKQLPELPEQNL